MQEVPSTKTSLLEMKSEQKCDEYAKEIVNETGIPCLVNRFNASILNNGNTLRPFVRGGTEAQTGEFPHMVALGKSNSNRRFTLMCGGTLISHTWVLTAAHCTHGSNGVPSEARLGFLRLTDQQPGVTVAIKNMTRHPDYAPPAMYADIALIELVSAITFTASIQPACLHQQFDTVPTILWISGWGITEYAGDQSDPLQKAALLLVDNLRCTKAHNNSLREVPRGITLNMICAGDSLGDWFTDTCQGDSGGPLQVIHSKNPCLHQIIGITSFGPGCAVNLSRIFLPNIETPGVYTRVSHFLPWIENNVWP